MPRVFNLVGTAQAGADLILAGSEEVVVQFSRSPLLRPCRRRHDHKRPSSAEKNYSCQESPTRRRNPDSPELAPALKRREWGRRRDSYSHRRGRRRLHPLTAQWAANYPALTIGTFQCRTAFRTGEPNHGLVLWV